jgi:oxygen-independent coproporphyrinogen III oxidase
MVPSENKIQSTRSVSTLTNSFGIYLHIPFCVHRCSYCEFYVSTKYQTEDFTRFTDALTEEIRSASRWLRSRPPLAPAGSFFFGGGTPSLLPPALLGDLEKCLRREFETQDPVEFTLETNPETVTSEFAEGITQQTGINRISLGAQSFNAKYLAALDRLADPEAIRRAARLLRAAGKEELSIDLIFALPNQTAGELAKDIDEAEALGAKHISLYHLTLSPGHPLYSSLPEDETSADLYESARHCLEAKGYRQYEVSNFAKPGHESKHNLLYWEGGDFLGVGPSAASRFYWDGTFHHRKQGNKLPRYLDAPSFPDPGFEQSTPAQTILEATFLELRKNAGIHLPSFYRRYEYDPTGSKKFPLFLREKLVERDGDELRLTAKGRLLADSVTRDLVD